MSDQIYGAERINREQLEFWNDAVPAWKHMCTILDRNAQHVCERMVELAGLKAGDRVLDVASGFGEPAVTAARKVGTGGLVVATDQSPAMLAMARERAETLGVRNIKFVVTGAEDLAVDEPAFDAALCRWGLMFVGDLDAAVRRIASLLDTAGRFATAVWGAPDKVPIISVGDKVVRNLAKLPPPNPGAPSPLKLANTKPLELALVSAGFKDVRIEPVNVRFEFKSPEDFVQTRLTVSTPFRNLLSKQTPEMQQRIVAAIAKEARRFADRLGRVQMDNEAVVISAHL
jgi:ubiquinone/menaquinone biosynthesis C-methylase UbiE